MTRTTTTTASVMGALAEVYDPELDEPITRLGFVSSCEVSPAGDVAVVLRLPTPQCAPNFAFLMAADARKVVRRLPDVREVSIRLEDHYTGDEINAALGRGDGFTGAFPGETVDDDLASLRDLFLRKALVGRQSRLCEMLLRHGCHPGGDRGAPPRGSPDRRPRHAKMRRAPPPTRAARRSRSPGVRAPERRAGGCDRAEALAAHRAAGADESRGQRRHLPLAPASAPRRGDRRS